MQPQILDEVIITSVKTKLQSIVSGSDYFTTFDVVYDNYPSIASIPEKNASGRSLKYFINLRDTSNDRLATSESSLTLDDVKLTLDIDIITRDVNTIRRQKADVLKCIGLNKTWDGYAFWTDWINTTRNKTDIYGNKISDITITIEIQYRQNAFGVQ